MNRLKILRTEKNITLDELRDALKKNGYHVSKATLSRIENGLREPKQSLLTACAEYFNVTADYIMGITNDKRSMVEIARDLGVDFEPELGFPKEQIAKLYPELDIKYIQLAKKMQLEEIDPKDIEKIIEVLKKHK